MKNRIACALFALAVAAPLLTPDFAEARGRGQATPYVMTPSGPVAKSVFYNGILPPEQIMQFRLAEQKWLDARNKGKKGTTTGTKPTAGKPTTAKKK